MVRRRFLSILLPATVLIASVGVDLYQTLALRSPILTQAGSKTAFPKPGPRRYPPGYQPKASPLLPH
jgi:hypothetical protein